MSSRSGGYLLRVSAKRANILRDAIDAGIYEHPFASEPVGNFHHSRNYPLVVFACLDGPKITHIADGKRGLGAGTGLVKLKMENWVELNRPIDIVKLNNLVEKRFRSHIKRLSREGGYLPPKTFENIVQVIVSRQPELRARLGRFDPRRVERIAALSSQARESLAIQKEGLCLSLKIAGLDTENITEWTLDDEKPPRSFLDGLSEVTVREDAMILADLDSFPGFSVDEKTHAATRSFIDNLTGKIRLTVVMANRLPLEKQTGADLIYCNDTFKSFVFVQYKAMKREAKGDVFRWKDDEDDDLIKETSRMKDMKKTLDQIIDDGSLHSFRLHYNPFFIKFCPKIDLNPNDKGLFKGMYMPLEYWDRFSADPSSVGPKGGKFLSYQNLKRWVSNQQFITLVAGSWIGTPLSQFQALQDLIKQVLESGRTITFAIDHMAPSDTPESSAREQLIEDEDEEGVQTVKAQN